ncbi:MAG: RNA methyltransferase [Treponema sp.]|jgi:TrmH RNA methyltransferase|nr:RNA methyltransferase [Treponema sp.]
MRNKLTDELAVCGFNAVAALGEYHPEAVNRLFLREDRIKSLGGLCRRLAERKRLYKICSDEELERICKSSHHQGVVAMIDAPMVEGAAGEDIELWAAGGKTGLVLYSVGNDHNLGAIIRAAAFFDVHFVILGESEGGAVLSTSAYRVAEGGMEHVVVRSVRNTAAFLRDTSKRIVTIGADVRARLRLRDLPSLLDRPAAGPRRPGSPSQTGRPAIALVLGNEETGLPGEVKEHCSALVRIPGTGNVESLNVAQAAALFLHGIFEL